MNSFNIKLNLDTTLKFCKTENMISEIRNFKLYAIFLEDEDLYLVRNEDDTYDFVVPRDKKRLYFGITMRAPDIRFDQHRCSTSRENHTKSRKLYNCLRFYGFDKFTKVVLEENLTEEEAIATETYHISKYDSFRNGLNSTPGGDVGICGVDHPNVKAVVVYNNTTRETTSFLCYEHAADFLGVSKSIIGSLVCSGSMSTQTYSSLHKSWFQVKKASDDTSFIENMLSFSDKVSERSRIPIVIVNIQTRQELEFSYVGEAADYFNIGEHKIHHVLSGRDKQFNVGKERYAAQHLPKTKEWDFNILPHYEAVSWANRKPIVIVNLETHIEQDFSYVGEAAGYFNIGEHNIQNVLSDRNKQFNVGKERYAAQHLPKTKEWDFDILPSSKARALKISLKLYYIDSDGHKISFMSCQDAASTTCGEISIHTQKKAIKRSYMSNGQKTCSVGYCWHLE